MWQIFSGAKQRRVKGYYNDRLGRDAEGAEPSDASYEDKLPPFKSRPLEKWASQIEKVALVLCFSLIMFGRDFGHALRLCFIVLAKLILGFRFGFVFLFCFVLFFE